MVAFDVVEDILLRSDAGDVLRCKSVCKLWYSLISTPPFVEAHLKKTCNNKDRSNTRIIMPSYWKTVNLDDEALYQLNPWTVVGSSNGLVCVARTILDGLILVNNPWTREVRKLPMAPIFPENVGGFLCLSLCLSFGYDASTNDYKVVMGVKQSHSETLIQVFSLKSNTWKIIGRFNYIFLDSKSGIMFNGSFYWIGFECNYTDRKKVILSFDLSREDFTIIPHPNDSRYSSDNVSLGIVENQLCVYFSNNYIDLPHDIWVMRSYNVEQSWERLPTNDCVMKYEIVHSMCMLEFSLPQQKRINFFCVDNNCSSRPWTKYITAHIFMPSLVSPYADSDSKTIVDAWSVESKVAEGEYPLKIREFFKDTEKIEETYRREVGEAENFYLHEDGI